MKNRVREAVFNLLGPAVRGTHAIDLFAGTGALGLEALSRGASRATLLERHFPAADIIRENAATLGVSDVAEVLACDTFIYFKSPFDLGEMPWTVFCSPPYEFYVSRAEALLELIGGLMSRAPEGSLFAVEADRQFDFDRLPSAEQWDVRAYPPAVVGVFRIEQTLCPSGGTLGS